MPFNNLTNYTNSFSNLCILKSHYRISEVIMVISKVISLQGFKSPCITKTFHFGGKSFGIKTASLCLSATSIYQHVLLQYWTESLLLSKYTIS